MQFKLNMLCSEVTQGKSNLFQLKITYGSEGGSKGMPEIKLNNNTFDVNYSLPTARDYTLTITLLYNGTEVQTYSNATVHVPATG